MLVNYEYYKIFITLRNIRTSQKLRLSLIIISPIYQGLLKILKTHSDVYYSGGQVAELS